MWYTTTRDFRTFSPPAVWQNPAPASRIDTTVIKVDDWYYRFTKYEAGNAGSDLFSEKNRNLRDSNIAAWTPVAPLTPLSSTNNLGIGRSTWVANQGYEGPVVFKANPGDTSCPQQFYLWGDRYTNGGGYQLSCSPTSRPPSGRPRRRASPTPARCATARSRRSRCASGTASRASPTRTWPPRPTSCCPAPAIKEGDTLKATVKAADGYETGGRVRFSVAGLGADRLPRERRGLGHAPGHAARRRRNGQGRVPGP